MLTNNYPSASELIRKIGDVKVPFEIVEEHDRFRVIRFHPPYFGGYEWWIVNEKGFLWEPCNNFSDAQKYLDSEEAKEYQEHEKPALEPS